MVFYNCENVVQRKEYWESGQVDDWCALRGDNSSICPDVSAYEERQTLLAELSWFVSTDCNLSGLFSDIKWSDKQPVDGSEIQRLWFPKSYLCGELKDACAF